MPLVHVRGGNLVVDSFDPEGPVDPGFGNGGTGPVDPGYGRPDLGPVDPIWGTRPPPGVTLPEQPPGVWPPLNWLHPIAPLPVPPPGTTLPEAPPGTIWPPVGIDLEPGKKYWVVAGIVGVGWRYVCVDPSLKPPKPTEPAPAPKA